MIRIVRHRRARLASLLVFALCLPACLTGNASAAELRPSWECLPEDTLLMVRVPDVAAFASAVGSRTKFGAVMMQPARLQKIASLVLEQMGKDAGEDIVESVSKQLGRHGLSPDDLKSAMAGDFGAAVIARDVGGESPNPVIVAVGWMESSAEDVAERLFAGIGSIAEEAIEAASESGVPVKRTDAEMAGHPTIWVQAPIVVSEKEIGTTHFFATRMERRLLFAVTAAVKAASVNLNVKIGSKGLELESQVAEKTLRTEELERESEAAMEEAVEEARRTFERFLARHGDTDGGAPLADLVAAHGMKAVLPAGVQLVEMISNPPMVANLLGAQGQGIAKMLAPFGVDGIGPIAWRQSLDGDVWRSNAFITLPEPRRGLARLLDEESDPSEVPAFVTREPIGFQQVSLDLGKAYSMLREAALQGQEPPPGNVFATAETAALSTVGMELVDLLSAFGTHHWIVSYPPRISEAIAHARRSKQGGAAAAGEPVPVPNPTAFVWRIKDEKPFVKLLELAGQAGGGKVVEEQGFRSVRFPAGPSIFLGQGHLVAAIGEGVAEKTLAAIRNPPADDDAFRTSDTVRRASELIPPVPGGLYVVADNRKTGGTLGLLVTMLAATSPDDVEEEDRGFFTSLQAVLPSAAEMEGMLGAATMLWRADAEGIVLQAASEMPSP